MTAFERYLRGFCILGLEVRQCIMRFASRAGISKAGV